MLHECVGRVGSREGICGWVTVEALSGHRWIVVGRWLPTFVCWDGEATGAAGQVCDSPREKLWLVR